MCSEFVTPQKNVLLATQPNLANDKKSRQVHKISYQNLEKMSSSLCSQTLGACPLATLKPRPLAGKLTRGHALQMMAPVVSATGGWRPRREIVGSAPYTSNSRLSVNHSCLRRKFLKLSCVKWSLQRRVLLVILSSPSRWLFTKLIHLLLIWSFFGNLNKDTDLFCTWSHPGNMHFRDEGIAS